jgi:xylulokinase
LLSQDEKTWEFWMSMYMGLDSSTQSLSAMIINSASGAVVVDESVNFGADLPEFGSPNGFLPHENELVKHSDPLMWVAALELLFTRLHDAGAPLSEVRAISGSGQQHGSVYLNAEFAKAMWHTGASLVDQLRPCLSRSSSPIWMDSSTGAQCAEIATAVGGNDYLQSTTGSPAIERFTGPQIRRFYANDPEGYGATQRIHLVSSFMASVLANADVPIDRGDGAGMNLMSLQAVDWDAKCLEATAPGLADKLPPVASSSTKVGEIAAMFCERYGFSPGTAIVTWSGDNPCSLVGMGASAPGTAVISLGTSDTYFAAMSVARTDPRGYGHVFGNPAGGFMSLICFKNGSLAREAVANAHGMDWPAFSDAILTQTEPGNGGNIMLPYFESEITPLISKSSLLREGSANFLADRDPAAAARAVVEAQAVSMKLHADWIAEATTSIRVTGGGANSPGIRQVLADVFGARIERLSIGNSAALGAALQAATAMGESMGGLVANFAAVDANSATDPNPAAAPIYAEFATRLQALISRCE